MSRAPADAMIPEMFFPIATAGPALQQISAAKAVCGLCTVHARCLSYALETMQDGGGTTGEECRAMRKPSRGHPGGMPAGAVSPAAAGLRAMAAPAAGQRARPARTCR
jgi:hypothetical protein